MEQTGKLASLTGKEIHQERSQWPNRWNMLVHGICKNNIVTQPLSFLSMKQAPWLLLSWFLMNIIDLTRRSVPLTGLCHIATLSALCLGTSITRFSSIRSWLLTDTVSKSHQKPSRGKLQAKSLNVPKVWHHESNTLVQNQDWPGRGRGLSKTWSMNRAQLFSCNLGFGIVLTGRITAFTKSSKSLLDIYTLLNYAATSGSAMCLPVFFQINQKSRHIKMATVQHAGRPVLAAPTLVCSRSWVSVHCPNLSRRTCR